MAFRYYPGKSQSWLEAKLDDALEVQASGGVIPISGSAGEVSFSGQPQSSLPATIRTLLHDLHQIDPASYPDSYKPSTRTTAVFRD